jgi:lipopolysaccharide biosynthesis glycosyltransferase
MTRERHFAFAAEGDYAIPLATAVGSLVRHLASNHELTRIWILDLDAEPRTRRCVENVIRRHAHSDVELEWMPVTASDIRDVPVEGHLVPVTYARLLLPALLPPEIESVIYLDSDLVVRRDLSELANLSPDSALAAVQDYAVETIDGPLSGVADATSKPNGAKYFNCGVLVMNLRLWRELDLAEQLFAFAQRNAPLKHSDQDALNALVADWRELPLEWNVQSRINWLDGATPTRLITELRRRRGELDSSGYVLHFSGPSKPWDPWYRNPDAGVWRRAFWSSGALSRQEMVAWAARYYPRRLVARILLATVRRLRARRPKQQSGSTLIPA